MFSKCETKGNKKMSTRKAKQETRENVGSALGIIVGIIVGLSVVFGLVSPLASFLDNGLTSLPNTFAVAIDIVSIVGLVAVAISLGYTVAMFVFASVAYPRKRR
jgi:hypothetical protein